MTSMNDMKAALFDLDGVVFDTEPNTPYSGERSAVSFIPTILDWSTKSKVRRW